MVVIGGGATGAGIALDAAARGFSVLLLEQHDFGKGTSSRSTKLVHGGVRYLQQGNVPLVREALRERERLFRNAPHCVQKRAFILPAYTWWEKPFYGTGLAIYDAMSRSPERSRLLTAGDVSDRVPDIRRKGLRGGVLYHDGQFDDTALLLSILRAAAAHGAELRNYSRVNAIRGQTVLADGLEAEARVIINATGAFADEVRSMSGDADESMVSPSQGVHLVFAPERLPSDALLVPRTPDGRVMFAIPWLGRLVVGTTDTAIEQVTLEPQAQDGEIDVILRTAAPYFEQPLRRQDIRAVFTGIRPLVKAGSGAATSALARDHVIRIERSGMITICGGKWTTYRRMAEECVDLAMARAGLPYRASVTAEMPLPSAPAGDPLSPRLHPEFPYTEDDVRVAVRDLWARTVEDVLARRTRILFLDVEAALACAPRAAAILSEELGRDQQWRERQLREFRDVATAFIA